MNEDELAQLSAYLDGDLEPDESARVEAWLDARPAAQDALRGLQQMRSDLQASSSQPKVDLWPNIDAAVAPAAPVVRGRFLRRTVTALALAAAVALAFVWGQQSAPPAPEHVTEAKTEDRESLAVTLRSARTAYEAAIDELGAEALKTRDRLPAETRRQLAQSLAAVDEALKSTRAAVSEAPNDPMAHETLLALYEEKVRVLGAAISAADLAGATP